MVSIQNPVKFSAIMILVGIVCVGVAAPVVNATLGKLTIFSADDFIGTTSTNLRDAKAWRFSLGGQQKALVRLSTRFTGLSITLKIVASDYFASSWQNPATLSANVNGRTFVYDTPVYYGSPGNGVAATSITIASSTGVTNIEFAGSASGTVLISIPGDYVLFVYGTSSTGTQLNYEIDIMIDGPGKLISDLLTWVGIGLALGFLGVLAVILMRRGVRA
jgi:hypothetical protein